MQTNNEYNTPKYATITGYSKTYLRNASYRCAARIQCDSCTRSRRECWYIRADIHDSVSRTRLPPSWIRPRSPPSAPISPTRISRTSNCHLTWKWRWTKAELVSQCSVFSVECWVLSGMLCVLCWMLGVRVLGGHLSDLPALTSCLAVVCSHRKRQLAAHPGRVRLALRHSRRHSCHGSRPQTTGILAPLGSPLAP